MVKKALGVTAAVVLVGAQIALLVTLRPFLPPAGAWVFDQLQRPPGPVVPIAGAEVADAGPGSLVSATTMPWVARTWAGRQMVSARVRYRSTNGDNGSATVVSGSVFTPKGDAPDGGWPVISLGHATIGIDNACAPSLSPILSGFMQYVGVLVGAGYAVALADFQGLGAKGVHPYTDSKTAGFNMIDAVRALRHTFADVSDRWVAMGDSQGAGAAWSADEQAGGYAPELTTLGAVAASPGADLVGLVDKAEQGTLTPEQRGVIQAVIESLGRIHTDIDRDDFRKGGAASNWNVLSDCSPAGAYRRAAALKQVGGGDFTPHTRAAANRMRDYLRAWALPQRPLSAPMYVWYGGEDPYIDAVWTRGALIRACALGGTITIDYDPEGGHNPSDATTLVRWIRDRFEGKPARNDC